MRPAFELITVSENIDFDDSILKTMAFFINAETKISETMVILFPLIRKTFDKHSMIYKEFFNLVKAYCKYGKTFLEENPEHLQTLFGYGSITIFHEDNVINGAVYLSQLFLITRDFKGIDSVINPILEQVGKRLIEDPKNYLSTRILYEVYLSAMINAPMLTLDYLKSTDPENNVLKQLLEYSGKKIECKEERRLFTVCFTNLMTLPELPDLLRTESKTLIENVVSMLVQTSKKEAKSVKRAEKKNMNIATDKSSDDSFYDSDDLSEESEEEEEKQGLPSR
jgi:hypothetical protein